MKHQVSFPPMLRRLLHHQLLPLALLSLALHASEAPVHEMEVRNPSGRLSLPGMTETADAVAADGKLAATGYVGAGWRPWRGVVQITDATSGELLHSIVEPEPGEEFGRAVALSDRWLAVGAPGWIYHSGAVYLYDLESNTPTDPIRTIHNPGQSGAHRFGSSIALDGGRLLVGAPGTNASGEESGRAYLYDVAAGAEGLPVVLDAGTPTPWSRFGEAVALAGEHAYVGAPYGHAAEVDWAGAVHVYSLDGAAGLEHRTTLSAPEPISAGRFGCVLDASGSRVVAGAVVDSDSLAWAAFVFDMAADPNQAPVAKLEAPAHAEPGTFISAVALSGKQVAVGTVADTAQEAPPGSVWMFEFDGGDPQAPRQVASPDESTAGRFGHCLALSADFLLVGTELVEPADPQAGSAYLLPLAPEQPVQFVPLRNTLPTSDEMFGQAMAVSGDLMIVGVPRQRFEQGVAYVFDLRGPLPLRPIAVLENPDPGLADLFGVSVDISGSLAVVGSYRTGFREGWSGAAYVFDLASDNPAEPATKLLPPDVIGRSGFFGYSVAVSGSRVVVGSFCDKRIYFGRGEAFVFDMDSPEPAVPLLRLRGTSFDESFGADLDISGNLVAVGAPSSGPGYSTTGSCFLFDLERQEPATPNLTLRGPGGVNRTYGSELALHGKRLLVGAPHSSDGRVFLHDVRSASPATPVLVLKNPEAPMTNNFGAEVGLTDRWIAVGAPWDDSSGINSGKVFVYTDADQPEAVIANPRPSGGDEFGRALGTGGEFLAVGVPGADELVPDRGTSHVYRLAGSGGNLAYDNWTANAGLAGPDADPTAAPFGDGVLNLLKFAFNMDGAAYDNRRFGEHQGDAGLPRWSRIEKDGKAYLKVEFLRSEGSSVRYQPLVSSGLANWRTMSGTETVVSLTDGWERVTVVEELEAVSCRVFGRIRVEIRDSN